MTYDAMNPSNDIYAERDRLKVENERLVRDLTKERETIILLDYLRQGSVGEVWAHYEQRLADQRAEIEHLDGLADRLKADVVRLGGEGVELRHQLKNQQAEIERLRKELVEQE